MWGVDDAVSNGAYSDPKSSPVNGTAQHDHNTMSAAAATGCLVSRSSENRPAHCAASKFAKEKTESLKCVVCHNASSEASDISVSHGAALSSADGVAMPPTVASLNCRSVTRTSRHLYSDYVTDDDGYFINTTDRNTFSAPNVDGGHVCVSVSRDAFSTNGVDLRSSLPHASVNASVHADDHINHNSVCSTNDDRCAASEEGLVSEEASSSSTSNTDVTETLTSDPTNADLYDDGYMDEIDVTCSSMVGVHGHMTAWFMETDTCLDDFIDADMPHNAAVAGSPSSSSLSSMHDEPTRMPGASSSNPADTVTVDVTGLSESDVSFNSQQQSHGYQQHNSCIEEYETIASNSVGLGHNDWLNGKHDHPATYTAVSQTPPLHNGRCLESDTVTADTCHGVNMQIQSSNSTSESSHGTPPASLPSPSDYYYSNGESVAAAFLNAVADEQVFEDSTSAGSSIRVKKPSDGLETHDRRTGLKQNQSYWLPIGPESDSSPKFGCWSCVEVMNNARLSLPAGYVTSGKSRPRDCRDSGIMWRSATGDYTSRDHSNLWTDDCENSVASVLSSRMSSSLTL